MQAKDTKNRVYIEKGRKKVLAGSVDWPGWVGMGESEAEALIALFEAADRYAAVMHAAQIDFNIPVSRHDFDLLETVNGGFATDFGGPHVSPHTDSTTVSEEDYMKLQSLLMACWQAFDAAVASSEGRDLLPPKAGVALDVYGIINHVIKNDQSDLERLGWAHRFRNYPNPLDELRDIRESTLRAMTRATFGEIPQIGLTGEIWTVRYFVRKLAWHTLDHAWEIEDRLEQQPK
jgi:hypothetical protein